MSYRFADSLRAGSGRNRFGSAAAPHQQQNQTGSVLILLASCQKTCMTYTNAVCTVKNCLWWTEECPKHVEFHSKNKFEKLVHLVGFIIRILNGYIQKISRGSKPGLRGERPARLAAWGTGRPYENSVEVLSHPMFSDFRKSIALWTVPRVRDCPGL